MRSATIKLALPNLRWGARIYRFLWYCKRCYEKEYQESLSNPKVFDIPVTRKEIQEMIRKGTFLSPKAAEHLKEIRKHEK